MLPGLRVNLLLHRQEIHIQVIYFLCQLWYIFLPHSRSVIFSLMGKFYGLLYCNLISNAILPGCRRYYTFQWIQIKLYILKLELSISLLWFIQFYFCLIKKIIFCSTSAIFPYPFSGIIPHDSSRTLSRVLFEFLD